MINDDLSEVLSHLITNGNYEQENLNFYSKVVFKFFFKQINCEAKMP